MKKRLMPFLLVRVSLVIAICVVCFLVVSDPYSKLFKTKSTSFTPEVSDDAIPIVSTDSVVNSTVATMTTTTTSAPPTTSTIMISTTTTTSTATTSTTEKSTTEKSTMTTSTSATTTSTTSTAKVTTTTKPKVTSTKTTTTTTKPKVTSTTTTTTTTAKALMPLTTTKPTMIMNSILLPWNTYPVEISVLPATQDNVDKNHIVLDNELFSTPNNKILFGHYYWDFSNLHTTKVGDRISLTIDGVQKDYIVDISSSGTLAKYNTDIVDKNGTSLLYSPADGVERIRLVTCYSFIVRDRWVVVASAVTDTPIE